MHPLDGLDIKVLSEKFENRPTKRIAWEIINEFFEFYEKDGLGETIWYMLFQVLRSSGDEVNNLKRGNLLHFYEYCKNLK